MKEIERLWTTRVISNQLQVIGKCPNTQPNMRPHVLQLMLISALKFISDAKKTSDCFVLSKKPDNIICNENNRIFISFTLIFRTKEKAEEYAAKIQKRR